MITKHLYKLRFELTGLRDEDVPKLDRNKTAEILYVLDLRYFITEDGSPSFGTYDSEIFQRNKEVLLRRSYSELLGHAKKGQPRKKMEAMLRGDPQKPIIDFITDSEEVMEQ